MAMPEQGRPLFCGTGLEHDRICVILPGPPILPAVLHIQAPLSSQTVQPPFSEIIHTYNLNCCK